VLAGESDPQGPHDAESSVIIVGLQSDNRHLIVRLIHGHRTKSVAMRINAIATADRCQLHDEGAQRIAASCPESVRQQLRSVTCCRIGKRRQSFAELDQQNLRVASE
jgi:hypothetical protein